MGQFISPNCLTLWPMNPCYCGTSSWAWLVMWLSWWRWRAWAMGTGSFVNGRLRSHPVLSLTSLCTAAVYSAGQYSLMFAQKTMAVCRVNNGNCYEIRRNLYLALSGYLCHTACRSHHWPLIVLAFISNHNGIVFIAADGPSLHLPLRMAHSFWFTTSLSSTYSH